MSLLVASENPEQLQALSQLLAEHAPHLANTVAEVEAFANALDDLSVLLCDYDFSVADGRVVAAALRGKFPALRVAYIAESTEVEADGDTVFGPETTPDYLVNWIAATVGPPPARKPTSRTDEAPTPPRRPTTLLGLTLGDYEIREKRREFETTESYLAWQQSMGRFVVLERLRSEFLDDDQAKRRFRALVRARASVTHPSIASVYEAQETRTGDVFYTRECVQAPSLEEMMENGQKASPERMLHLLKIIGQTMGHYAEGNVGREIAKPYQFFLAEDGLPRVGNIALPEPIEIDQAAEISQVAKWVSRVAETHPPHAEFSTLMKRLQPTTPNRLKTWREVAEMANRGLDAAAARQPVDDLGKLGLRKRKPAMAWLLGGGTAAAAVVVAAVVMKSGPEIKPIAGQPIIRIPATSIPGFEIDRYEVTIDQYEAFLAAVGSSTRYNHPQQPTTKTSHQPQHWEEYLKLAHEGKSYMNVPMSLRSPVMWVDWWDAFAYANWRGRRLPTDQEWQLAARGETKQTYTWGNDPKPEFANTGDDYNETDNTKAAGQIDGHAYWCDVDAVEKDRSPFGVIGLGGNVSEWTSTWDQHPSLPDQKAPVICGGSFFRKSAPLEKQRWVAEGASAAQPHIGFRTVSAAATK